MPKMWRQMTIFDLLSVSRRVPRRSRFYRLKVLRGGDKLCCVRSLCVKRVKG